MKLYTLAASLFLFLTSFGASAHASELGRYLSTTEVKTQTDQVIPIGSEVQMLGVLDVSREISPSGRLATFNYQGRIFNADAAKFEKAERNSNFSALPLQGRDDGNSAALCTTLNLTKEEGLLNLEGSALEQFVKLYHQGRVVGTYAVQKPKDAFGYYRTETDFCVAGLGYSTDYKLEVLKGLPAKTRENEAVLLDSTLTFFARTPHKTPAIHLSTAQNILPLSEDAVIPFSATNVKSVKVEVYRVDPRSLTNSYDIFQFLDGYGTERLETFLGDKIGESALTLDGEANSTRNYNINLSAALAKEPAGLYVAVFQSDDLHLNRYDNRPTQWFMRSDVAISVYSGLKNSDIFLTRFGTTDAVKGAEISIIAQNNKILFKGSSNDLGHVRIDRQRLRGTGGHSPKYLVVSAAEDSITILPLDSLDAKPRQLGRGAQKSGDQDVYLTSEREMYRAGEQVHVMAVARDRALNAIANQEYILKLKRADGTEIDKKFVKTDENGVLNADFDIKESALLGRYELNLISMEDRQLATLTIRVEDFVPLTIEAKLNAEKSEWAVNEPATVTLGAEYFSGGPANGLKGEVVTQLKSLRQHEKEDLKDFVFGGTEETAALKTDYFSALTLDAAGKVVVKLNTAYKITTPGLYQVQIDGKVFDVGGRPNGTRIAVPLSTASSYVGLRSTFGSELDEGTTPTFEVIQISRDGTEQPLEKLSYSLTKVSYGYDSYYDNGWRWRKTRLQDTVIETGTVSSKNLALTSALSWGAYEMKVQNEAGMQTTLDFYAGWGGNQNPTSEPEALELSLKKTGRNTAKVRFNAPFDGKLRLMTASTDIHETRELEVTKGDVELDVDLPENVEPGVHVLATLIRPISENSEHLPQFAVGSAWSGHLGEGRLISTKVTVPESIRSRDVVNVNLEVDQPQATAMLFLVDEGIHALTGFKNGNLSKHFYQERELALGLLTNFGRLIRQDRSLQTFRVGGDGDLSAEGARQQSEFFKTVAAASPLLEVMDGKLSYQFPAPEFEGRLRLVAFVASKTGLGFREATLTVQDPVSLDISLPRFVGVGDQIAGRLALRANEAAGDVRLTKNIDGTREEIQTELKEGGRFESAIPLSTNKQGRIPIQIQNQVGGNVIVRDFALTARLPSYPMTENYSVKLSSGQNSFTKIPPLLANAFSLSEQSHIMASLNISPVAGAGLAEALAGLDRYPYGCIEQVSSTTRGLLARAAFKEPDDALKDKINHGIEEIIAKQKPSGAFGYWNRSGDVYSEYQPYAVETLMMARSFAADQVAVEAAIQKGLNYLYGENSRNVKTRLYTYGLLAENGFEVTSRARYSIDHELKIEELEFTRKGKRYPYLRERLNRLSLAYWVAAKLQDKKRLASLDKAIEENLDLIPDFKEDTPPVSKWLDPRYYMDHSDWLQSGGAPEFGYLLTQLPKGTETIVTNAVVANTLRDMAAQQYRSTEMNAKLAALHLYQRSSMAGKRITIDGTDHLIDRDGTIRISLDQLRRGVDIRHDLEMPLLMNAEITGLRETVKPVENGFRLRKFWSDAVGNPIPMGPKGLNARQGDLFTVVVEIQPLQTFRHDDLLLTDLLPSGFEIEDALLNEPSGFMEDGKVRGYLQDRKRKYPNHIQKMDDRYVAHFKGQWDRKDVGYVTYVVRAAYPGSMQIPDAHVEFMYAPSINGRTSVEQAKIEPAK